MIQLILYAAVAAGIAFTAYQAWDGFTGKYIAEGKQIQMKADQPILDKAKAKAEEAEANAAKADIEAGNARSDTAKCVSKAGEQSDLVRKWQQAAADAQADVKRAKAAAAIKEAAAETYILSLREKAAAPPVKDMSCQVELGKAKKILQDQLRRSRGIPIPAAK